MGDCTGEWSTKVRSQYLTRNTKELDHERLLVSVILDSLSERHWLFIYMEIVARRTPVVQELTGTDLYIFNSDGEHVFDPSMEQIDRSLEQRLSLAYYIRRDLL
jgi:hypothetical protein